jgi:hypothetical protein
MAIKLFEKYTPRANVPDGNYPYGSIKNESLPDTNDGTPLDKDWGNDMVGFTDALLNEAGITPSGNPDTVLASDRLDAVKVVIEQVGQTFNYVEPLGNKNIYMRDGAVPGADAFPSSATSYTVGQEFVWGMFAGTSGATNVLIDNATGLSWTALTIELRYEIEDTSKFGQGDETVYIVDNAGVSHWLKVADVSALTSTLVGSLLTVTVDFAIFAELSITSILQIGLQDVAGVFGEKNVFEVYRDTGVSVELIPSGSYTSGTLDWSATGFTRSDFRSLLIEAGETGLESTHIIQREQVSTSSRLWARSSAGGDPSSNLIIIDTENITETSLDVSVTSTTYTGSVASVRGVV